MSEKYRVNVKRLALLTLPTAWRKPLMGAIVYAIVTPIGRLVAELVAWRGEQDYRLRHNGQVCKLRAVLNDEADPGERRITIEDAESTEGETANLIYRREEGRWVMLPERSNGGAVTVNRRGYGGVSGYDFWVNIPEELRATTDESRLRAIINKYKLASKRYAINYK